MLRPGWKWFGQPDLNRLVGKATLLYAPDLYFPPLRRGLVLSTIRGVAYLKRGNLLNPRDRKALTKAFHYARAQSDYFLAVSQTTRDDLLECTDIRAERIYVVSHGVDPQFAMVPKDLAREAVQRRYNLRRPYLLFVGAVALHKNIEGLIEAFSIVANKESDLDLVLAGSEENAAAWARARIAAQGLENRVHFLGQISQQGAALRNLYNAAEMLIFPSFYEGWCAPPLEAMACGLPVVCSNVPSVAEVVGEAAMLVAPDEFDAISHAISKVLTQSELRRELIEKGCAHVAKHTWEGAAARLENIFIDLLGKL